MKHFFGLLAVMDLLAGMGLLYLLPEMGLGNWVTLALLVLAVLICFGGCLVAFRATDLLMQAESRAAVIARQELTLQAFAKRIEELSAERDQFVTESMPSKSSAQPETPSRIGLG